MVNYRNPSWIQKYILNPGIHRDRPKCRQGLDWPEKEHPGSISGKSLHGPNTSQKCKQKNAYVPWCAFCSTLLIRQGGRIPLCGLARNGRASLWLVYLLPHLGWIAARAQTGCIGLIGPPRKVGNKYGHGLFVDIRDFGSEARIVERMRCWTFFGSGGV